MRRPAPCTAFCAVSGFASRPTKSPQVRSSSCEHHRLRAIRIVHVEHRSLGKNIACRPMSPDARDFPRSSSDVLRDSPPAPERRNRRSGMAVAKNSGLPRDLFRVPHVRNNRLQRLLGAGRQPCQCHRSAHQLQEVAARTAASTHSEACRGNSRCSISWNSSVFASSSRLRQYCGPSLPQLTVSSRRRGCRGPRQRTLPLVGCFAACLACWGKRPPFCFFPFSIVRRFHEPSFPARAMITPAGMVSGDKYCNW